MNRSPLSHLHVVDLTDLRGAFAGRILADLGADVLKIEPPGGDPGRLRPPFAREVAAPDRSLPFLYRNANKRGCVIDLADRDSHSRFLELCDRADVLIENLSAGEREQFDLTPGKVRSRHPHLVHAAIADFGLDGPRAGWRLEPLPAFAASGALYASGFRELPPCWLPGHMAHDCASVFAAAGVLGAVLDRARHGEGQTVEVSVQEAALSGLNPWSMPVADYSRVYPMIPACPPRNGDGPYFVLATADGYVRVLPATARQWRGFLAVLGNPEALQGPEWEIPLYRIANGDVIRLVAAEALASRKTVDVLRDARRHCVLVVPVNTPDDFVREEQTRVRGYFRRTGFPHVEEAPFAGPPFNFSVTPASLRRPAPAPGEDDRSGFPPRSPEDASRDGHGPVLAGIRVVDLGVGAVVPELCWVLAEMGAEVIKVESRANFDFLRNVTVEPGKSNTSWTFNDECRGQKSVLLDFRTERGRELALRLCAAADVVAENNRGGVVRHWGLDYEDVRRLRPDVIYVSSQGFGQGGPLGESPSFGPLNSTFAGINWLWNHPEAPYPAGASLNHPDHVAGKLGAVAVLAALEHRRRTGEGQRIEMSQSEKAAYFQGEFYLESAATGRPLRQQGNRVEYAVPHGVYPAAGDDRWIAIAVVGDDVFIRFAQCLGWTVEPGWASLEGRLGAREEIDARVSEWTRARDAEEAAAALQAAGVSAMPVQNGDDHRADPHLAARGAIVTVTHAEIGPERHARYPLRASRMPFAALGAAPLLGEHTRDVLGSVLGLAADEIERLTADGVCQ